MNDQQRAQVFVKTIEEKEKLLADKTKKLEEISRNNGLLYNEKQALANELEKLGGDPSEIASRKSFVR